LKIIWPKIDPCSTPDVKTSRTNANPEFSNRKIYRNFKSSNRIQYACSLALMRLCGKQPKAFYRFINPILPLVFCHLRSIFSIAH